MRKKIATLLSLILLAVAWELFARIVDQPELIPSLSRLVSALADLFTSGSFFFSAGATIVRGITGMFLSLVAASVFAWIFARNKTVYELCRPVLIIMRSVPVISFILLALIFLDTESIPLMIAFLTMFPLLAENLAKGICSLQSGFSAMATLFHIGRYNCFMQITYPQLKPFLFSGLASAMGFGWRAVIMGEVLSQCTFGIGSAMKRAQSFIAVPELIAWTVIAILISFLFDKGIGWLSQQRAGIRFAPLACWEQALAQTVSLHDVGYRYGVTSFSFTFEPGKIYGISAPSGTGKTTLLDLINGMSIPTKGTISINRDNGIPSVFQEPQLLPWLTATENIALILARLMPEEQAMQQARSVLKEMQLDEKQMSHYPDQLSYGQQQRIAIARALSYPPSSILLMDEPFKGLDDTLRNRIIEYIKTGQTKNRKTIIFTSHNADELDALAEQVVRFD